MARHDQPLASGSEFGRYTIVRRLGAGGMGAVYEGLHVELRKRVAIKTLLPDASNDEEFRARFIREGEAAARLRHPNVVDISDVGVHDGMPYLVMELLEGEDLGHLLAREGAMDIQRLVDVMLPVLDAVAAAHEEGIVHRDIKPENVFLVRTRHGDVEPKLLDFGISKVTEPGAGRDLTATNTMLGTMLYMSPEQAQNSKDVDGRTDQYSLGVMLYAAATGRHPFAEVDAQRNLFALLTAIITGKFAPPRSVCPQLPEPFERVILRAMSTQREDRFDSIHAVSQALLPFASQRERLTWEPRFLLRGTTDRDAPALVRPSVSAPSVVDTAAPEPVTLVSAAVEVRVAAPPPAPNPAPRRPLYIVGAVATALVLAVLGVAWIQHGEPHPSHALLVANQPPVPSPTPLALPIVAPPPVVVSAALVPPAPSSVALTPSPVSIGHSHPRQHRSNGSPPVTSVVSPSAPGTRIYY